MIKKILFISTFFIAALVNAQSPPLQRPVTYGYELRNLLVDTLSGIPKDTFNVPTVFRPFHWIAAKGDSLYKWSPTQLMWVLIQGGGGSGTGTVTALTQAYGIINTPNPITTTGTIRFDSATVFPQLRATIAANTDSLFGVQDNLFAANRAVNMNGRAFRWSDGGILNYWEYQIENAGYIEFSLQNSVTNLGTFSTTEPGYWTANSANVRGAGFFATRAYSTGEHLQAIGNDWNQSGQWVDLLQEHYNDGTNGGSYWYQHREKWTGTANFTSSLMLMDSLGVSMRTRKSVGSGHLGYIGLLVDSNSNVRFENYPDSRADGLTTKALYIGNASGDIEYGTIDSTSAGYQTFLRGVKIIDSLAAALPNQTLASTSDATSHTVTLSNSGGSIQLVEGSNITLTTSGTGLDGIVTIAASGGASGWELDGNALTAGSETGDFIGSTNSVSMRFRTNNVERLQVDSNGTVLINKATAYTSGGDGLIIHALDGAAFRYALMVENSSGSGMFYVTNNAQIVFAPFTSTIWGGSSTVDMTATTTSIGPASMFARFKEAQGADVASAAGAIALGADGNSFEITGTNAITLISNVNWQNGSVVTLAFTSTATLTDGTANSGTDIGMELAGNANFVASAGATLTLRLIEIGGTQRWREIARSVQ